MNKGLKPSVTSVDLPGWQLPDSSVPRTSLENPVHPPTFTAPTIVNPGHSYILGNRYSHSLSSLVNNSLVLPSFTPPLADHSTTPSMFRFQFPAFATSPSIKPLTVNHCLLIVLCMWVKFVKSTMTSLERDLVRELCKSRRIELLGLH
ncbi:hypothetical protein CRENBAI_017811 [Crenichthys baileyi]|uniref:Uncharacterized protein n=1 Tax=Crenichthys baileyi TaxID=28760 RepID=A0AAV9SJI3_9TELE